MTVSVRNQRSFKPFGMNRENPWWEEKLKETERGAREREVPGL
jgi:hypothetical protein